jgi:hypothetical protein
LPSDTRSSSISIGSSLWKDGTSVDTATSTSTTTPSPAGDASDVSRRLLAPLFLAGIERRETATHPVENLSENLTSGKESLCVVNVRHSPKNLPVAKKAESLKTTTMERADDKNFDLGEKNRIQSEVDFDEPCINRSAGHMTASDTPSYLKPASSTVTTTSTTTTASTIFPTSPAKSHATPLSDMLGVSGTVRDTKRSTGSHSTVVEEASGAEKDRTRVREALGGAVGTATAASHRDGKPPSKSRKAGRGERENRERERPAQEEKTVPQMVRVREADRCESPRVPFQKSLEEPFAVPALASVADVPKRGENKTEVYHRPSERNPDAGSIVAHASLSGKDGSKDRSQHRSNHGSKHGSKAGSKDRTRDVEEARGKDLAHAADKAHGRENSLRSTIRGERGQPSRLNTHPRDDYPASADFTPTLTADPNPPNNRLDPTRLAKSKLLNTHSPREAISDPNTEVSDHYPSNQDQEHWRNTSSRSRHNTNRSGRRSSISNSTSGSSRRSSRGRRASDSGIEIFRTSLPETDRVLGAESSLSPHPTPPIETVAAHLLPLQQQRENTPRDRERVEVERERVEGPNRGGQVGNGVANELEGEGSDADGPVRLTVRFP